MSSNHIHLFHPFLCKSEMNAGQFSNHHGSLIIVSNVPWNYFLENQKLILQIFWENKCTVTGGIGDNTQVLSVQCAGL